MKKIVFILLLLILLFLPLKASARSADQITDWYIKDFQTEITANKDSSLNIVEKITADCGNLPNKHGIFRVLPARRTVNGRQIKNPIKLISITDFNDKKIPYTSNKTSDTITWKIGDAAKTVTGENYYKITYRVERAINFSENNDQFYWNLTGNQWVIDIDQFEAKVNFPAEINSENSYYQIYSGNQNIETNNLTETNWDNGSILVKSTAMLNPGQGISLDLKVPKSIFVEPPLSFMERYGSILTLILALILSIIPIWVWFKYGKDPKLGKSVVPEFGIPENLPPMQIANIERFNSFSPKAITAELIELAVKGYLQISEIEKGKILGLSLGKDYELTLLEKDQTELKPYQKELIQVLFANKSAWKTLFKKPENSSNKIKLSDLNPDIGKQIREVHTKAADDLTNQGYFSNTSFFLRIIFVVIGIAIFIIAALGVDSMNLALITFIIPGLLFIFLGFLMSKRTPKGAELLHKIRGFRLYMRVAEKYRQQFNEKENIFEKFLPYAIVFGLTDLWVKKMKQIYGEKYFATYHPVWFAGSVASFDVESFTTSMNQVASAVSSSSASGGGGAGGGGGGGGGGGW